MKPLIGITSAHDTKTDRYFLAHYYTNAVECGGGIPIILPPIPKIGCRRVLNVIDGLLLSGGSDLDPQFFGEEPHPALREITPERDEFEISLTKLALNKNIPILAICRGIQVLNIAAGGDVLQDISAEINNPIKHSQEAPRWYSTHRVDITVGSQLKEILGQEFVRVNSFHHQSVGRIAPGFKENAQAVDGVIEGIESEKNTFAIGVQWHPECMVNKDEYALKLFQAFIKTAEANI